MLIKKIISIVTFLALAVPPVSYASIDKNLKYGQRDKEVTELQEFLIDKGLLKTTPSNFFGLLTLKAVKAYQTTTGVSPTGFVGLLTREKINKEIEIELASSNEAEIQETGSVAQNSIKTVTVDVCKNIEGTQSMAPTGMFIDNSGNCFTPSVTQIPTTDVCKNIEGNQTTAPSGMFLDNLGNCFTPTTLTYSSPEVKTIEPIKLMGFGTSDGQNFEVSSNKKIDFQKVKFIKAVYSKDNNTGDCTLDLEKNKVCVDWRTRTETLPIEITNIKLVSSGDMNSCAGGGVCGYNTYSITLSKKIDDFMDSLINYTGDRYYDIKMLRYKISVTDVDGNNIISNETHMYSTTETGFRRDQIYFPIK